MERVFCDLQQQGIGAEVKHTPVISPEEENQLWTTGMLGTDTPVNYWGLSFSMLVKFVASEEERSNVI